MAYYSKKCIQNCKVGFKKNSCPNHHVRNMFETLLNKNLVASFDFFFRTEMLRVKDDIWKKFNVIASLNATTSVECKLCKSSVVGLVSRKKTYYEQCSVRHDDDPGTSDPEVFKQNVLPFIPTNKDSKHELNLKLTR